MRCHIVCHVDVNDSYQPVVAPDDRRLHVFVGEATSANRIRNNISEVLASATLVPSPSAHGRSAPRRPCSRYQQGLYFPDQP